MSIEDVREIAIIDQQGGKLKLRGIDEGCYGFTARDAKYRRGEIEIITNTAQSRAIQFSLVKGNPMR